MAKKNKKTAESPTNDPVADLFSDLAADTGGSVLDDIDSIKYFVDTGNLAVNFVCSGRFINGGVPGGRLTEIYGPASSGKSLIATNVIRGCQKLGGFPIYLDCENTINKDFVQSASHVDVSKVIRYTPQTLEEVFIKVHTVIKKVREVKGTEVPIVIVYDSISVSPSAREYREVELPENYTDADWKRIVGGKEQPGERAKICSREFRKLTPILEEQNATMVVVNQTREKIGVMFGSPETTGGGGNALPFYASCRIRTQTQKKIENSKTGSIVGINMKIKNMKNKTFRPFMETESVQLYFDRGINPLSGLLNTLIMSERIDVSGKGSFTVKEPWAAGEEIKFRSSMARNDVPEDVLYQCPLLIDAESKEQVKDYLSEYQLAIHREDAKDLEEKELKNEEDL